MQSIKAFWQRISPEDQAILILFGFFGPIVVTLAVIGAYLEYTGR